MVTEILKSTRALSPGGRDMGLMTGDWDGRREEEGVGQRREGDG